MDNIKTLGWIIGIMLILGGTYYTTAEGNITTSQGNLYLQPAGGSIILEGNITTKSDNLYLRSAGGRIFVPTSNIIQVGDYGSPNRFSIIDRTLSINSDDQRSIINFDSVSNDGGFYFRANGEMRWYMFMDNSRDDRFVMQDRTEPRSSVIEIVPGGNMYLSSQGGSILPLANKATNFGSSSLSWDNCYCDDYHTTSKGYEGSDEEAYNAVSKLKTLKDGEIDHSTVDESLTDNYSSISINSVTFANSKAITYLMSRIRLIEEENMRLRDRVNFLEQVVYNQSTM